MKNEHMEFDVEMAKIELEILKKDVRNLKVSQYVIFFGLTILILITNGAF